jgi:hypothetical protein
MNASFVRAWEQNKFQVRSFFESAHPADYKDVVKAVVTMLNTSIDEYSRPDPERITEIDDGDYQGTLVYVIGATGYQPSDYWYVKVWYGSCSGCDTLQGIRDFEDGKPSEDQVEEYMTLALHLIQGIKEMGEHA